MKKLFIIFVLISFGVISIQAQWLTKPTRNYTFYIDNDTITVAKDDNIVGVSVSVPTGATDTTWVEGDSTTFDGIVTDEIPIAPGESQPFGYDDKIRINNLTIRAVDKAKVILVPVKE